MTGVSRRTLIGMAVCIAALAALAVFLWSKGASQTGIVLEPDNASLVARGAAVYGDQCADCHGANFEGQENWQRRRADGRLPAPPHDASGHTWHHPDQQLFELTKYGPAALAGQDYESDMPGYEGTLSDEEIVAVLSYIKSKWPPAIRARHDQINDRAKRSLE